MANFVTIIRIFFVFIAAYLLFQDSRVAYITAFGLTAIAFAFDGLDGYLARKLGESSKLGAVLDIMSDRIVENTYWVLFAVLGWLPVAFPIIALTRGFVTDGLRSVAMEKGMTAFGGESMQQSPIGQFICCSKFSRITYAVAKLAAFIFLIIGHFPSADDAITHNIIIVANVCAVIAIEFCVIRALPVIFESDRLFKDDENETNNQ